MQTDWKEVSTETAVRKAGVVAVSAAGVEVALYAVRGAIYATENRCTHGDARLSDGFLLEDEIECPLHQGRFNVRDGLPMCAPLFAPVRVFPVKIDMGRVFVLVPVGANDAPSAAPVPARCAGVCPLGAAQ
ncbi:MAG: non-heme iron oxygenase ferredoxin subunit [Paraburkholderia sp.]|nr:MAG: non-heme iron oxygenase ferredoxin subunit [Paraburkholderia sp.]